MLVAIPGFVAAGHVPVFSVPGFFDQEKDLRGYKARIFHQAGQEGNRSWQGQLGGKLGYTAQLVRIRRECGRHMGLLSLLLATS
jgi:hypothetical protein